tara:strand:+ start:1055 stop:1321 length:267 start_codon:yes stop_codon:yes gene_type:complete
MAKKYVSRFYLDDIDLLHKIKWCFDRDIHFFPVVIKGQTHAMKHIPKVRIGYKISDKEGVGQFEYEQGAELYDKIIDLYLHKHEQSNK